MRPLGGRVPKGPVVPHMSQSSMKPVVGAELWWEEESVVFKL